MNNELTNTAKVETHVAHAEQARPVALEIARLLHDDKCSDILVMDVRGLSHVSDYIVLASGTSDRQMRSAADDAEELAAKLNHRSIRKNIDDRTTWIVVDFGNIALHVFEPNTRAHYDLEMLWGDAPRLEWERPDQVTRDRAGLGSSR